MIEFLASANVAISLVALLGLAYDRAEANKTMIGGLLLLAMILGLVVSTVVILGS